MRRFIVLATTILLMMGLALSAPGISSVDGEVGDLYYYDTATLGGVTTAMSEGSNCAVRFTPACTLSARIDSVSFLIRSPSAGSLQYAIFGVAAGAGNKWVCENVLLSPTDAPITVASGRVWTTVDVSDRNLTVNGDFAVAMIGTSSAPKLCFDGTAQDIGRNLVFYLDGSGDYQFISTAGRVPGIKVHLSYAPQITSPIGDTHVAAASTTADVTGKAAPNVKINIYNNETLVTDPANELFADGLGNFSASVPLDSGPNAITAEACFADGHKIQSSAVTITRDATLDSITVEPGKTIYWVGEDFDQAGLKVYGHYGDGTTKEVLAGFTVSPFNKNQPGMQDITVTYEGLTATFTVEVKEVTLDYIAVTAQPVRKIYCLGEQLDLTGLEVTAFYNDHSSAVLPFGSFSVSPFDSTKPSKSQNVTLGYQDQTTTFTVRVMAFNHTAELAYDSGTAFSSCQISSPFGFAVRFTPAHTPARIDRVSFMLAPTATGGDFQYAIFSVGTGAGGKAVYEPLTGPIDATASSQSGAWTTIDVSNSNLMVDGDFVVAKITSSATNDPAIRVDQYSAATDSHRNLGYTCDSSHVWFDPIDGSQRNTGNLMIRADMSYEPALPEITAPAGAAHATTPSIEVSGTAPADVEIRIYRDHGAAQPDLLATVPSVGDGTGTDNGTFAATVELGEGDNAIWAAACYPDGHSDPGAKATVTLVFDHISVTPATTSYYVGDTLDPSDLTVEGCYSDGTSQALPTGFTISGFDSSKPATGQVITITYEQKTPTYEETFSATFTVEVTEVALESIAITAEPTRKIYCVGEQLDLTGLEVTALYNDHSTAVLPFGSFSVSPFDCTKPSKSQNITLGYHDQIATFTVRVMAINHTGELAYDRGTAFSSCQISSPYGFAVRFTPDHAPARIDSISFMLVPTATGGDFQYAIFGVGTDAGGNTVYRPLTGPISATASGQSGAWTTIDVSGYNLMVDGDFIVAKITSSATNDPAIRVDQYSAATDSHRNLGYTCDSSHVWFGPIDGSLRNTGNLMIRADMSYEPILPEITAPAGGDHVSTPSVGVSGTAPAGAEVRIFRDQGSAQPELLASASSSDDGTGRDNGTFAATVTLVEGDNTIWAAACHPDGHSDPGARVTVTLVFDHISVTPTKTTYYVGDTLDPSALAVRGHYSDSDGTTKDITGFTVSGFDSSKPATGQVVTVTYQGLTATFTVEVREKIYTIAPLDAQTFAALTAGYTAGSQETKTITITRTGNRDLANLAVTLGGDHAADFAITQPLVTTLTNGTPSTTFTITAKSALAVGTHAATVTVSATDLVPVNFTVTQVVKRSPDDEELQPVVSHNGSAVVDPLAGGTISLGGDVVLAIPAHALAGGSSVSVSIDRVTAPPTVPSGFEVLGAVYELTVGGQRHYTFAHPITLTFTFDPSKLQPGETPSVRYYDEAAGQWVDLGGVIVGNTITVTADHFTRFAVMALEAPSAVLTDIAGHWAENAIRHLAATGATAGYPDGSFRPDDSITRAEFVTMLVRGLKLETKTGSPFTDCQGHWAESYIATAVGAGIAGGYDANTFGPDDLINREQMIAMIARAMRLAPANGTVSFSDQAFVSGWAVDCVRSAIAAGIISGYSDGTLRPLANATRAEAATMLANALK